MLGYLIAYLIVMLLADVAIYSAIVLAGRANRRE